MPVKPQRLTRKEYDARVPKLREELVQLQVQLKESPFKILLIIAGFEGAGRGEVINTLSGWLDPRGVETFALQEPTDEECERPFLWRFWRSLPTQGRLGIYAGSWYTEALREETFSRKAPGEIRHELERIRHFERGFERNVFPADGRDVAESIELFNKGRELRVWAVGVRQLALACELGRGHRPAHRSRCPQQRDHGLRLRQAHGRRKPPNLVMCKVGPLLQQVGRGHQAVGTQGV